MAKPRSFSIRLENYEIKYDGANVTTVLTAIKPSMDARYEDSVTVTRMAVETARRILNERGVPTKDWAKYLSFAQKVAKLTFSFSGDTLLKEVSAVKAYWIYDKKAEPELLDAIIEAIIGVTPAY